MTKEKKLVWHTEQRLVNELVPYEQNPRKMTEAQTKALTESLEKFDLVEIPAINTDNKIIAGHQRLKLLQLAGRGEEFIDVRVPNRELTEEEYKEYLLRSNQNKGEWDYDILANLFNEEELKHIGFSERELDMVSFDELEGVSFTEESGDTSTTNKYELIFATDEDYKEFTAIIRKLKREDMTLTDSLLVYLRENV